MLTDATGVASSRYSVLLVEDDTAIAEEIMRCLRSTRAARFDVMLAHQPEDTAIGTADRNFDVLLVDAERYELSRLYPLLPSKDTTDRTPVLTFVDDDSSALALELLHRGADDCLPLAELSQALLIRSVIHAIERRQAREALRRSEVEFRLVIENASDVIMVMEADGKLRYVSPAIEHLLGYLPGEMIDVNLFGRILLDDIAAARVAFAQCLQNPRDPIWAELRARHRDGSIRAIEVTLTNLLGEEAVAGIVVNVRDVTERQRLADQLRQAQKLEAIGRLAGGIAHDFNNILTVINGFAELIQDSIKDDDPVKAYVQQITQAGASATVVTRQLLAFSRQQVLSPRELDLNAVVRSAEPVLRRVIGDDIELGIELDQSLGLVIADPGQIEQVIMNLAAYARDSMPRGGRLRVESSNLSVDETFASQVPDLTIGRHVVLSMSDTGLGLDEQARSQIFEPFLRPVDDGHDTGLSLAAVYGIVKQSSGSIHVTSNVGRGTTFTVFLPRIDDQMTADDATENRPKRTAGGETILLVEDEARVRLLVRLVLESSGYHVLEADRGETGVEVAERHRGPIHLLVTDVVMPGMNGRELAEALVAKRPELRVIFMSGYTDDSALRLGTLQPGTQFVQKPFAPTTLAQIVRHALDTE